jgi:hypothetical protein
MRTLPRLALTTSVALVALVLVAAPALACGGLVGENGTIQLGRTTTLAAWHDGVERYVTSFEFTGEGEEVGSIVPLPGIPSKVERAGDWTLQRLQREVVPPARALAAAGETTTAADKAVVILQTKVDALDITILKGGGTEVGKWATDNGFLLTPDAPEVLDAYSQRSQIFMAAKFDAKAAKELGQNGGDGTPIMLTIPIDRPWVPLRILGLGVEADRRVEADVFLLTDNRPRLLAGGDGIVLSRSEPASSSLLSDLRGDKGMEWVPEDMWLSYLQLDTTAGDLTYDLATSVNASKPSFADAGIAASPQTTLPRPLTLDSSDRYRWVAATLLCTIIVGLGTAAIAARRARA